MVHFLHPEQPLVKIDTTNILFICGGTFDGISKIIDRRTRGGGIGFDRDVVPKTENSNSLLNIRHEDVVQYGFIPELVGRLQVLSPLEYLTAESMKSIFVRSMTIGNSLELNTSFTKSENCFSE